MASNTPFLDLYKKDPVVDKDDTFNITTMLNENWDKIDIKVKAAIEQSNEIATVKDVKGVKDFKWSLEHEDGKLYFIYEEA